jgi:hypothetical protein
VTDAELFAFGSIFQSVQLVFPLRGEESEIRDVRSSYFKALRRYDLRAVQAGADRWIQQGKRFPRPAEWIESIPQRPPASEIPELSSDETREYLRAEALRYEDHPCQCEACRRAGVTDKPLRFVPEFTADDRDKKARIGARVVVTGHWAHGEELARWYAAKEKFWREFRALAGAKTMQTTRPKPRPVEREPGDEDDADVLAKADG